MEVSIPPYLRPPLDLPPEQLEQRSGSWELSNLLHVVSEPTLGYRLVVEVVHRHGVVSTAEFSPYLQVGNSTGSHG